MIMSVAGSNAALIRQARLTTVFIVAVVLLALLFGYSSFSRFQAAHAAWEAHNERAAAISTAMAELNQNIGYGGFIHNFKNLVLRRDLPHYQARIDANIAGFRAQLDRFNSLLQTAESKAALAQVRATFEEYAAQYSIASSLLAAGASSAEIDTVVKVDDAPALKALAYLNARIEARAEETHKRALSSYDDAVRFALLGGLLVVVAMLGTAIFIMRLMRRLIASYVIVHQAQSQLSQFKTSLDHTLDCVFLFDAVNLQFFYVNDGAQQQVGYSRDELLSMHPYDIKPDYPEARFRELLVPLLRGEQDTLIFETVHRHRNGQYLPVEIFLQYIAPEDGPPRFVNIVRDISERKQAEAERNRIANLLGNVLDGATELSVIATNPQGLITIFNRGSERMLGYTAAEMVGKQTPALIHLPAEVVARGKALSAQFDRPVEGFRVFVEMPERHGSEKREWTYIRRDGQHIPVSLVVTTMRDSAGEIIGYLGIAEDITERKRAEQALRENDKRMSLATLYNGVGIWDLNLKTQELVWDESMFALYSLRREDFSGAVDAWEKSLHPDDRERGERELNAALAGEKPFDTEFRVVWPNGEIHHIKAVAKVFFDDLGKPIQMLGTNIDITARKQTELALSERKERLTAILNTVVDGIVTINAEGIIETFNPAAEHIFGYAADEVIGQNVKLLMPEPYHSQHDSYLGNFIRTREARVIGIGRELTGRRKDKTTFPMELGVSEMKVGDDTLFTGVVRDITERKRVERMKNEFVSTVSHELRTPLTSIVGVLGLLEGGALGGLPEQAKSMVQMAHRNSQRLTHLINDLLDMEKIAAGKMSFNLQSQELMPLLEQALEANRNYVEQYRVSYVLGARADGVEVKVDSQRLIQVLSNFLSNAAKFSPAGGVVEVAVQRMGWRVRVEVRDHGPGIPEDFRARIFDKFSQADSSDTRSRGGTGLGLAISKQLVESMGGQIGFDSVAGQGATFFLELPIMEKAGNDAAAILKVDSESIAPRILVVEDDADVARMMTVMLHRAGYQVDVARKGGQALSLLEQKHYTAMTLDLVLPDISGLELLRQVRHRSATINLPIIVVSVKMEEGQLAINGNFSGIEWLPKPVDETVLLAAVKKLVPQDCARRSLVLHIEDDTDLHQVIRAMAGSQFEFELATTLAEAQAMLAAVRYDVVILDLGLPDGSGWELLPRIHKLEPAPQVIILSGTELTPEESAQVEASLLKSRMSQRELLDALSHRINKNRTPGGAV